MRAYCIVEVIYMLLWTAMCVFMLAYLAPFVHVMANLATNVKPLIRSV